MKRREFIRNNTISFTAIPFLSFYQPAFSFNNDNPEFPFTSDFPEATYNFKLHIEPVEIKDVVICRSVKNEQSFLTKTGKAYFDGKTFTSDIILDIGREIVGRYSFMVESDEECEIKITYGEGLDEVVNGFEGINWYNHPKDIYVVKSGNVRYTLQGRRAFRYFRIESAGTFAISSLEILLEHYPVKDKGSFYCSDPVLNQMWQVSLYTTKLCMQQFYEDGIKRDGLLWVSDYRVQFLCNAYTFADLDLARKSLFIIAASQRRDGALPACSAYGGGHQHPHNINYMGRIPFSYGAHWILINYSSDFLSCLNDYLVYTGDHSIIGPMLPTVERLIGFLENVDYQPNPKMPMGRDRLTDDAGVPSGQNGILQGAFLFQVFINLKDGEELLKDINPALSERCRTLSRKVEYLIDQYHFDPVRKVYNDFPESSDQVSWHTNFFACLSGKVKPENRLDLLRKADELTDIEPGVGAMKMFQAAALFEAGWAEKAVSEMKRYWGLQLKAGATVFWEYLKLNPVPDNLWESALMSRCHGWSAGPAYLLPRYVLGVRPVSSWAEVIIEPLVEIFEWAEGTIPSPYGDIQVSFQRGRKALVFIPDDIKAIWINKSQKVDLVSNRLNEILL